MIKFVAALKQGSLYGFGLTEADLNRMEFNNEPLFFDFGYAGHPDQFGLILYTAEMETPGEALQNFALLQAQAFPFLNPERGVTLKSLNFFPLAKSIMQKFREVPLWGFNTELEITSPGDMQIFFSGRTEEEIEEYLQSSGLITKNTKRTTKGFGN
jgi:hypothetical protein